MRDVSGSFDCGGKSAAFAQDDDFGGWVRENRQQQKRGQGRERVYVPQPSPDQAGSGWGTSCFRVGQGEQATARATTKAKCGGPSTAAAKAPPSLRMTKICGWARENRQRQEQKQRRGCGKGYWRLRRRRSWAVASRWQGRQRVRRLSRSHWPPPSATGRIWSASQRERRAVMDFIP